MVTPRLRWLLGIAAALAVCCAVVLIGQARSQPKRPTRAPAAAERASKPPRPPAGPTEDIVLVVQLPAEGEPLSDANSGHPPDCPQAQVSALLGIEIAAAHGIRIGNVLPNGPAAEAGIASGDSIMKCAGDEVTCPRTLLDYLEQGKERKPIELTVRRPVTAQEGAGGAAKESAKAPDAGPPAGSGKQKGETNGKTSPRTDR
jgi:hypothetical protein